jgi:Flp pilus assembly protein TadD
VTEARARLRAGHGLIDRVTPREPHVLSKNTRGDVYGTVALAALVFVAFFPSLTGGWLWDDDDNITRRAVVQRFSGIADIWTRPRSTQQFYPLTHTSFWLEWQLFGGRPIYFHALNLVLHACTAVVCWRILRLVIQRGAWLAAALWAVHPIQVESVAWITERKNVLAGVFASLAVWTYVRGVAATPTKDETSSEGPKRASRSGILAASGCFVLALTAKSAVAPLPMAMLAAGELRRRRLTAGKANRHALLRDAWRLMPLFALGLGAAMVTAHLENASVGAGGPEFDWPPVRRLLVACHALWFYPQKLLVPFPLSFEYPMWDVSPSHAVPWFYVLATAVAVSVFWLARTKIPSGMHAAVLTYVALMGPALSIVNVYFMRYAYAQDHFQYFACAPLLALVAWTVLRVAGPRPVVSAVATALVLGLAVTASAKRSFVFRSNDAVFTDAIAVNPDGWHAYAVLAHDAKERGDTASLVTYLEHVTRNRPSDPVFQDALGMALIQAGRRRDAIDPLRRAAEATHEGTPEARANPYLKLGGALEATGHCADARHAYETAHELAPDTKAISMRLALQLVVCPPGDAPRAIDLATQACEVEEPHCLSVLAATYAAARDFRSAIDRVSRAESLARMTGDLAMARNCASQREAYRKAQGNIDTDHDE